MRCFWGSLQGESCWCHHAWLGRVLEILRNGWSCYFVTRLSDWKSKAWEGESISGLFLGSWKWFWCIWVQGQYHVCVTLKDLQRRDKGNMVCISCLDLVYRCVLLQILEELLWLPTIWCWYTWQVLWRSRTYLLFLLLQLFDRYTQIFYYLFIL